MGNEEIHCWVSMSVYCPLKIVWQQPRERSKSRVWLESLSCYEHGSIVECSTDCSNIETLTPSTGMVKSKASILKISIIFASNVNSFFFTFELHAIDLPLVELFNAFSSAAVVDFWGTEITENKMKKNNKNSHISPSNLNSYWKLKFSVLY
jgi:hypothetical protein